MRQIKQTVMRHRDGDSRALSTESLPSVLQRTYDKWQFMNKRIDFDINIIIIEACANWNDEMVSSLSEKPHGKCNTLINSL